jgi:hypothetical protein
MPPFGGVVEGYARSLMKEKSKKNKPLHLSGSFFY